MADIRVKDAETRTENYAEPGANVPSTFFKIGNNGRYLSGPILLGSPTFGDSAQILSSITAQNCILELGKPYSGQTPTTESPSSKLLGFEPHQGIAIEDSTAGVISATKARLSVIG